MKQGKQILSLVLVLLLLCGIPMSVSAVGTAAPDEFELVGAIPMTQEMYPSGMWSYPTASTTKTYQDKTTALYFNQPVDSTAAGAIYSNNTYARVVVVDSNNNIVKCSNATLLWGVALDGTTAWGLTGARMRFNSNVIVDGTTINTWTGIVNLLATHEDLVNSNCRLQLRIHEINSTPAKNSKIDNLYVSGDSTKTLNAPLNVDANANVVTTGGFDCAAIDIGTVEPNSSWVNTTSVLTLDSAAMYSDNVLKLNFSEAVSFRTAALTATLDIVDTNGNTVYLNGSTYSTTTTGIALSLPLTLPSTGSATCSVMVGASSAGTGYADLANHLNAANNSTYSISVKFVEKTLIAAQNEYFNNWFIDPVWGTNSQKPLLATAYKTTGDVLLAKVSAPNEGEAIVLKNAQPLSVQGKEYVVLTFSEPVSWLTGSTAPYISLNVINQTGTVISVGGSTATRTLALKGYYGPDGTQIITELSGTSNYGGKTTIAEIRELIGDLGTNRLVARIIDKSGVSGTNSVDSFYSATDNNKKLPANMLSGSEEWAVVDLSETAIDPISVESVYVHNERNLLVTFDRAVVAQPNLYSAIRLVDENNTLYFADDTTGNATVYSATSAGTATKHLQWQVSAVTLNGTGASQYSAYGTSGCQLLGTLGINYSKLLEIEQEAEAWFASQGTSKDLHLRLCFEEKNVNSEYGYITSSNGVVDSVYAADGSSCLSVSVGNANGHYAEVTGVVNDTLADRLAAAKSGDTVSLVGKETVTDIDIPAGVTLDLAGCTLTANTVTAIAPGSMIIDSTDGEGGIKINKNVKATEDSPAVTYLNIQAQNTMLPLYDTGLAGYRFFTCTTTHLAKTEECKFGFRIAMNDTAYTLLKDAANADMKLITNLVVTVDGTAKLNKDYVFSSNTVAGYADKKLTDNKDTWAITLTVTGFNAVTFTDNIKVTSAPRIESSTGVQILPASHSELSYTHSNNA